VCGGRRSNWPCRGRHRRSFEAPQPPGPERGQRGSRP
jgi:hypothetical protein